MTTLEKELEVQALNNNNNNVKKPLIKPQQISIPIDEESDEDPESDYEECWCTCCKCCECCDKCKFNISYATFTAVLIGIGVGILIQQILNAFFNNAPAPEWLIKLIAFPGKLWVKALKLIVIPLLASLMLILPTTMKEQKKIGKRSICFFFLTSTLAAFQGLAWVSIIKPGTYGEHPTISDDAESLPKTVITEMDAILSVFENAIPENIIKSMTKFQILGIICFFYAFGVLLNSLMENNDDRKRYANTIIDVAKGVLECSKKAVVKIIWFMPFGMCSMVASTIIETTHYQGLLKALGIYVGTLLAGHTCHVFIVLSSLFALVTGGENPYEYFFNILRAPITAFITSSSAATLPTSIDVSEKIDVNRKRSKFILSLGSAINMDGTALGFPVMTLFIAQYFGETLSVGTIVLILVLSIFVSIGSAPLPNAGIVYIGMLLHAAGLEKYTEKAVPILIMFDSFVDRIETFVNVTSDFFITRMVDFQMNGDRGDGKQERND